MLKTEQINQNLIKEGFLANILSILNLCFKRKSTILKTVPFIKDIKRLKYITCFFLFLFFSFSFSFQQQLQFMVLMATQSFCFPKPPQATSSPWLFHHPNIWEILMSPLSLGLC